MAQYSFGTGSLWGQNSSSASNTPIQFGALQGVNIDITFTTKELYSSYQYPIALGRGTAKITGKASFAQFNALILNDLFFAESTAVGSGQNLVANAEAGTIPGTPYTITVTHAATFLDDLGVVFTATGLPLKRVASGPATGEYSVVESTGVYTFAAADTTLAVKISYVYSTTTGKTITITNQLLGNAAFFSATFTEIYNSKTMTLQLNQCMSSKFTLPFKLEDFTLSDFEFMAFSDSSNTIGKFSMAE